MNHIEVRNQTELDKALSKSSPDDVIVLVGNATFEVKTGSPYFVANEGSPRMVAWGSSSPRMEAWGSSSPSMEAWESSSPRMVARGSSSPRMEAWGSSSPSMEAWESSSPSMVAWGSSSPRMEAWGSSSVTGSVGKYAGAHARIHDRSSFNVAGAVILTKPDITTPADWCEYHGIAVKRGVAILFKAVDDDWSTDNARRAGIFYTPGSKPAAPDWDGGVAECGGGLHFSPHPILAREFNGTATRYVACPVKLVDIAIHKDPMYPAKVKAARVSGAIYEVDRDGEPIEASAA